MFKMIFKTDDDIAILVARLMLGIVFFPHGMQKLFGWFGGYGFSVTLHNFTDKMGIPVVFALLAIIAESFGSLGVLTGFLTRIAAFGIGCVMVVAVLTVHIHNGFFMNWFGNKTGEGFEYHLLAIGLALVLMIKGGGLCSLDSFIWKKSKKS
jgi:putative oxidoreductase